MSFSLTFKTHVNASKEDVWAWITSVDGISKELSPLLKMTTPKHVKNLSPADIKEGQHLFVSILLLFKILPFDYSKLTILRLENEKGFLEQSPMGSMKLWRHERLIKPKEVGCEVVDVLDFEPRFFKSISHFFVKQLFSHRHKMLAKYLGAVQ